MAFKLFDGVVVEDAEKCALQRLLLACLFEHPKLAESRLEAHRYAATIPLKIDGPRVWFRFKSPQSPGEYYYISLHPGGYREKPPDNKAEIVQELGPVPPGFSILEDLRSLRDTVAKSPIADEITLQLADTATNILDGKTEAEFANSRQLFRNIALSVRNAQPGTISMKEFGDMIGTLYSGVFHPLKLPNLDFSAAMLLLRLQVNYGWAANDLFENPHPNLHGYLATLRRETGRPDNHAPFKEFAGSLFQDGANFLNRALDSWSLMGFQKRLYQALHYFSSAWMLASNAKVSLGYESLVAEESFCCCLGGLQMGERFYRRSPFAIAEELAPRIGADIRHSEFHLSQEYASPKNPELPKFLFRLFFAQALVLKSPASAPEGMRRLKELEAEFSTLSAEPFLYDDPVGWFDLVGSNMARKVGDTQEVQRRLTRIAGRLVVRKHFQ